MPQSNLSKWINIATSENVPKELASHHWLKMFAQVTELLNKKNLQQQS
jgi:hypothetical protein